MHYRRQQCEIHSILEILIGAMDDVLKVGIVLLITRGDIQVAEVNPTDNAGIKYTCCRTKAPD